jgi:hypothetical protein
MDGTEEVQDEDIDEEYADLFAFRWR